VVGRRLCRREGPQSGHDAAASAAYFSSRQRAVEVVVVVLRADEDGLEVERESLDVAESFVAGVAGEAEREPRTTKWRDLIGLG
jgi:hypothetical protein